MALDITADLPHGTTVLEASAGTGKTYTITSLVARYVADGVPIRSILVITFTRAAANELRTRIRARLRALVDALPLDDPPEQTKGDELVGWLRRGDRGMSLGRLETALADLDAATIATVHEFAGSALSRLGLLAGQRPDKVFLADHGVIVDQVTDDLYLRSFADTTRPPFSRRDAHRMVGMAVRNPNAPIVPDPADSAASRARVEFTQRARAEVERRLDQLHAYTYDDIISGLNRALGSPTGGAATVARLRDMYRVVMVDEFQDTDPGQWHIIDTAFHGHCDVILIGDPKQAIYAFRGGDVQTYLHASHQAHHHRTLDTNWRSDAGLVNAVTGMFEGLALGDPGIRALPVDAVHESRISTAEGAELAPVRLRVLPQAPESVDTLRDRVRADVVVVVSRLLGEGTRIRSGTGGRGEDRPVRAGDIAVLVRSHRTATMVAQQLRDHGIPALLGGSDSVLHSPAARAWQHLLETLVDPQPAQVHQLALTPFVDWDLSELVEADDDRLAGLFIRVRAWAQVLQERGVAALLETMLVDADLAAASIRSTGSSRLVTDLRHIGQLLHVAQQSQHLDAAGLARWLAEAGGDSAEEDAVRRRLDSDGEAVRVLTMHSAKGLEFPIVLLPDVADRAPRSSWMPTAFTVHDAAGERQVDVGGKQDPTSQQRHRRCLEEDAGEDLRLLYVAMTRASRHLVMWWAPHPRFAAESPLHRLLCGAPEPDGVLQRSVPVRAGALPDPDGVEVSLMESDATVMPPPRPEPPPAPVLRHLTRAIDRTWRRTSYSGLVADQKDAHHLLGAPVDEFDEPTEDPAQLVPVEAPAAGPVSPWDELPSGARFGTLVHAVLESWDPHLDDFAPAILDGLQHLPVADLDVPTLVGALKASTRTPLGGALGATTLADIAARDRLNELDFEMPLGSASGTDAAPDTHHAAVLEDLADMLAAHLGDDHPLAPYPDRLRAPGLGDQVLRGFLTGSIDAVLRVGTDSPRFVVVDYKTNRLGPPAGSAPLRVDSYTPELLAEAMMGAHYPLQALLYAVALHRYLAWRLPGYDPARHLGGIRYLFLRGMAGPDTPTVGGVPCGVFAWDPPPELVTQLADLVTVGTPTPTARPSGRSMP